MSGSGSAVGQSAPDVRANTSEFSYWRVWLDGDEIRVARDWRNAPPPGPRVQPQHLEVAASGYVEWADHAEAAIIPAIPLSVFLKWLEQGGAA